MSAHNKVCYKDFVLELDESGEHAVSYKVMGAKQPHRYPIRVKGDHGKDSMSKSKLTELQSKRLKVARTGHHSEKGLEKVQFVHHYKVGSAHEVYLGIADHTSGGLDKSHLMINWDNGKIVNRKKHARGVALMKENKIYLRK